MKDVVKDKNDGISPEEMEDWIAAVDHLKEHGFKPNDVLEAVLDEQPQLAKGRGSKLLSATRSSLDAPLKWKHLLYGFAIGVGIYVFLKWVAVAFDIEIPLVHRRAITAHEDL